MTVLLTAAIRRAVHCMGTVISFDVRSPGVAPAELDAIIAELHQVDATFSTYRPDSEISRLDRGELALPDCSPDVRFVLDRCAALRSSSEGYFDAYAGGRLDPSGFVKGWALQRASDRLLAAGARNHCVNGGGDVVCRGTAVPGAEWTVGVADPCRPGELIATIPGRDLAVATSGTAERGRHIVDPRSGTRPAAYASITVVGHDLASVDALATAAFAAGEDAPRWLAARGLRALLVRPDGRTLII